MKRTETYEKEIAAKASDYLHRGNGPGVMQLCGQNGMGKTLLARNYCKNHNGLYFSFRNLDAVFAPRVFIPECNDWAEFFGVVQDIKNRPVIFFDDMDDRNDKEDFFKALLQFAHFAYIVLIYRREVKLPIQAAVIQMKPMNPVMLRRSNKKLSALDALRIIAVTDGIPGLVSQFDLSKSFEENIRSLFTEGSLYLRYASDAMQQVFRSPESYNTLLYGLVTGHNRISQLATFSGFPKNKCDKYLKALDAAGFLETEQKKDKNGNLHTHYYPKGGYFRTWYLLYFPQQQKFLDPPDDELLSELLLQIDKYITSYYFWKCCWQWMRAFSDVLSWEWMMMREDPMQYDVTINGVNFDYVQLGKDQDAYVTILSGVDDIFTYEIFRKIEAVTTKTRPFYSNRYYIFSLQRMNPMLEKMLDYDTVTLVDTEKFFTRDYMQFWEKM